MWIGTVIYYLTSIGLTVPLSFCIVEWSGRGLIAYYSSS